MSPRAHRAPFLVLFAGVGGQGALSAARFLGVAGHRLGLPLTVSQLHGMSQRNGSVEAMVHFGTERALSLGSARVDVLVGLDLLEALRMLGRVDATSTVLSNRHLVPPPRSSLSGAELPAPEAISAEIRRLVPSSLFVDASDLAERAGGRAALNVVMLGAFSGLEACPVPADGLLATIRDSCPPRSWPVNELAFALGREALGSTSR